MRRACVGKDVKQISGMTTLDAHISPNLNYLRRKQRWTNVNKIFTPAHASAIRRGRRRVINGGMCVLRKAVWGKEHRLPRTRSINNHPVTAGGLLTDGGALWNWSWWNPGKSGVERIECRKSFRHTFPVCVWSYLSRDSECAGTCDLI